MAIETKKINFNAELDITKSYDEDSQWYIEGYAMTSDYDMQGDIIAPEAIASAEKDLQEYSTVLYNHDKDKPIGVVKQTKVTKEGLWVKVLISKTEPEIWKKIQEGVLSKFSIRGQVLESVKQKIMNAGKEIWANIIKAMKLIEISLVSLPANPKARTLAYYMSKALEEEELKNNSIIMLNCSVCGMINVKDICDKCSADIEKAIWSSAYVNDLPDSCFAYISSGGKKDELGKTTPRSLRHLPYKDKDGKPDVAHVRNALARLSQTQISAGAKASARRKLVSAARGLGIEVSKKSYFDEEVEELFKELESCKGLFGEYAPRSRLFCYGRQFNGVTERKINEMVKGTFSGKIISLSSDEDYGAYGTIDIDDGAIMEVNKAMADIKKADGTLYTQEEIDLMSKELSNSKSKLDEISKAEEVRKAEIAKAEEANKAEIAKAEEARKAEVVKFDAIQKENDTLKKENDTLKSEQAEKVVDETVQKKWDELKGKAFEVKDESVIKPILKKSVKGESLTMEETETLINKKIKGSLLKLGFDEIQHSGEITPEKKASLIGLGGIRIKKVEKK